MNTQHTPHNTVLPMVDVISLAVKFKSAKEAKDARLLVLLAIPENSTNEDCWVLPNRCLGDKQTAKQTAQALLNEAGIKYNSLAVLPHFSAPNKSTADGQRVLSLPYLCLTGDMAAQQYQAASQQLEWFGSDDSPTGNPSQTNTAIAIKKIKGFNQLAWHDISKLPSLEKSYGHDEIIQSIINTLAERRGVELVETALHLLPKEFIVRNARLVCEILSERKHEFTVFKRYLEKTDKIIVIDGEPEKTKGKGRPAKRYRKL
ncbi:hypothetical protein [Dasania marina]|uniref:hypothetical protein n=1 Tax=Dasania marina TaxID=471499 RepID=UPI0003770AC2|nr:hypothetical protein [Dasania marina]